MPRVTFTVRLLFLAFICGSTMSCCCNRWWRADGFVEGLRCGMTEEDVSRYTANFRGARFLKPERSCQFNVVLRVTAHRGTTIACWFRAGKLEVVQVDWISRPMRVTIEPKRYLCKNEASWRWQPGRPKVGCGFEDDER